MRPLSILVFVFATAALSGPASAQYLGTARAKASAKKIWIHGVEGRISVAEGTSRWIRVPSGYLSWEDHGVRRYKNADRGTRLVHVQRRKGRVVIACYGRETTIPPPRPQK